MHKYLAKNHLKNYHLYHAFNLYGIENFTFEVIKNTYDLDYWERAYIYWYKSQDPQYGYNYQPGGEGGWDAFNNEVKEGLKPHPMSNHIWTQQQRQKMSESRKGKYSGEDHYLQKMSEEDRKVFISENAPNFFAPWWNNGTTQVRSKECPGPGWTRGLCKISPKVSEATKGTHWYNNGTKAIRAKTCPEGFVPGRLKA